MLPIPTRQIWEDLCEGVRILRMAGLSLLLQSVGQASLLNYKIRLGQLDHQLQESYREIGERLFLKMSAHKDRTVQNLDFGPDEATQRLFETVARLEQSKKVLLEEMDELK